MKPLDSFTYFTKGYTAYIDRVEEVLELLSGLMPSAGENQKEVSLYLLTDGLDNSSSEEDREEFEKNWKV